MPKNRGRGRRQQGTRRFEQKATSRPIAQPTVQKTASPTTTTQTAGVQRPTKTAAAQRPTQEPAASVSHVRSDIIRVGVVTMICILLLIVLWAILR
jgi:hypothetical protein